jgi:hypothetical protein
MRKRKTVSKSKAPALREGRDSMRAEYDFSKGVRGVTARRFAIGSNIVVLDPDVAAHFPDSASVNRALRALTNVATNSTTATRSKQSAKASRAKRVAGTKKPSRRSA